MVTRGRLGIKRSVGVDRLEIDCSTTRSFSGRRHPASKVLFMTRYARNEVQEVARQGQEPDNGLLRKLFRKRAGAPGARRGGGTRTGRLGARQERIAFDRVHTVILIKGVNPLQIRSLGQTRVLWNHQRRSITAAESALFFLQLQMYC